MTRETALAIGPASRIAPSSAGSMPAASAKRNASASPVTSAIRKTFTASLVSSAPGTSPQRNVEEHSGASSGSTRSSESGSPASIATSWPASAGTREPDTGASTYRAPARARSSRSEREYDGEVVPMCTTVRPATGASKRDPSRPRASSIAAPSASISSTTSHAPTSSVHGRGAHGALLLEVTDLLLAAVPHRQPGAGPHQVGRHRLAHVPQADEPQPHAPEAHGSSRRVR